MNYKKLFSLLFAVAIIAGSCVTPEPPDMPSVSENNSNEGKEEKGTTPISSIHESDIVGKWKLHPEEVSSNEEYNWYIQFYSDGTFVETYHEPTTKWPNVGTWNINYGILTIKYYTWGATGFYFSNSKVEHTFYITEFAQHSCELYFPESTVKYSKYFILSRQSFDDMSFSGYFNTEKANDINATTLCKSWYYADKKELIWYTFFNDRSFNKVVKYGYGNYDYYNYNGSWSLSYNIATVNLSQFITSGCKRSSYSQTETYKILSNHGDYIIMQIGDETKRCFKSNNYNGFLSILN